MTTEMKVHACCNFIYKYVFKYICFQVCLFTRDRGLLGNNIYNNIIIRSYYIFINIILVLRTKQGTFERGK
jgi:hypothetical protein